MLVPGFTLCNDRASGDVERRKQGGGPVTNVIVGDPFDIAESHWQHPLSPIQGLNLALFVNAKHDGVVGDFR